MISVLASSAVDRGFDPRSGPARDYKIGICRFYAKHEVLRGKTSWLGIRIMCTSGATYQSADCSASTIKPQLSVLVYYKADLIIISLKINLFSPWYSWIIAKLALSNNHSLTHLNRHKIVADFFFFWYTSKHHLLKITWFKVVRYWISTLLVWYTDNRQRWSIYLTI